ncbi:ankyrin repeat domain-containing protein [Pseudoxanthomonas sp. Root630]|uniref:ankyrin repeat domain-containing protein n=1 Tax=Pseudoxanthomonas sp. Root630 TaxID=1736574 RepID=UPI000703B4AE|nr:ankyrin repeat domain-containing protein [Pseudoxanthomonas sp. Root630]KRA47575.1 hypothetical protein ASD72_20110 [Pseudoxanthomonas sp. Root630]
MHSELSEARDAFGETTLHKAAAGGDSTAAAALLSAGADPNAQNAFGVSPLHLAAEHGHPETVTVLIAGGAKPNLANRWRQTPLHYAAIEGHGAAAVALLAGGANPNARDKDKWTPIHETTQCEDGADLVAVLAAGGANLDVTTGDDDGYPAVSLAITSGNADVLGALLAAGANPNTPNPHGATPLHVAVFSRPEFVPVLLARGADATARDMNGKIPSDYATGDTRALLRGHLLQERLASSEPAPARRPRL